MDMLHSLTTAPSPNPATIREALGSDWKPRDARVTTTLLVGRLVNDRADHICRIRNVSAGGMMVECEAEVASGSRVRIEIRTSAVSGTVAWTRGERIGIKAVDPIEVRAILDIHRRRDKLVPRAPRLSAAAAVKLSCCGRVHSAILRDISQGGCRLALSDAPAFDGPLRIAIPGLPPQPATMRWSRDGEAGFAFVEPYPFKVLGTWQSDYSQRFVLAG